MNLIKGTKPDLPLLSTLIFDFNVAAEYDLMNL